MKPYVTDVDRSVYHESGFGRTLGLGRRPALIVIDVQHRTVGDDVPVLQSIREGYASSCGSRAHAALPGIRRAIAYFRAHDLPVLHACVAPKTTSPADLFQRLNPKIASVDARGYEFHPDAAPGPDEAVVPKEAASAFFGTPLVRLLVQQGNDSVVLAGCTTSGCVRASAVDAFSYNFATTVLSDAVYDRTELSHEVGLFELSQKYADVMTVDELISTLPTATP